MSQNRKGFLAPGLLASLTFGALWRRWFGGGFGKAGLITRFWKYLLLVLFVLWCYWFFAPLFWWKQFDTYRVGISKSSESTMHRSWKSGLQQSDFEHPIFPETLSRLNTVISDFREAQARGERFVETAKSLERTIQANLPDAYLQTRLVNVNAKTLRNIYFQRCDHKLIEWHTFCTFISKLPHAELITTRAQNG